jgi:hypothetical protein
MVIPLIALIGFKGLEYRIGLVASVSGLVIKPPGPVIGFAGGCGRCFPESRSSRVGGALGAS